MINKRNITITGLGLAYSVSVTAYIWSMQSFNAKNSYLLLALSLILVPVAGFIHSALIVCIGQKLKSSYRAIIEEKHYLIQTAKFYADIWCYSTLSMVAPRVLPVLNNHIYIGLVAIVAAHAVFWLPVLNADRRNILSVKTDWVFGVSMVIDSVCIIMCLIMIPALKIFPFEYSFIAITTMVLNFIYIIKREDNA